MEQAGIHYGEAPPVPIPNTEVKLTSAENTWREAAWKDRSLPAQKRPFSVRRAVVLLLWYGKQETQSSQGTQTWKGGCEDAVFQVL